MPFSLKHFPHLCGSVKGTDNTRRRSGQPDNETAYTDCSLEADAAMQQPARQRPQHRRTEKPEEAKVDDPVIHLHLPLSPDYAKTAPCP